MLWIVVPLLLGIIALVYTVAANLLRVWLNHRVKIALLERLQADPAPLDSPHALQDLVNSDLAHTQSPNRVDYVVAGVTLAALGTCSALAAWCCGAREWMAGAYLGGIVCVAVGFILTLLGLLMRYLSKLPLDSAGE